MRRRRLGELQQAELLPARAAGFFAFPLQNTVQMGYNKSMTPGEREKPPRMRKESKVMFDIFNMIKKDKEPETKVQQVTRETIIGDILDMDETTAPYFLEIGMHCLGCPASRGESLEEACAVHGVDCDELIAKLNAHLAARG